MEPEIEKDFNENLVGVSEELAKLNSIKRRFFVAILQGVGGVIGATIVASLLLVVLSRFVTSVEQIPLIGGLVESIQIQERINPSINTSD